MPAAVSPSRSTPEASAVGCAQSQQSGGQGTGPPAAHVRSPWPAGPSVDGAVPAAGGVVSLATASDVQADPISDAGRDGGPLDDPTEYACYPPRNASNPNDALQDRVTATVGDLNHLYPGEFFTDRNIGFYLL
jgi:hypothetical protein